ncbi:MAG TPA: YjgP/YjgQ family permease [Nitrospirae bacterium]|nr:YjgP/YjgQ family permease [Nitrospirota bacterium]
MSGRRCGSRLDYDGVQVLFTFTGTGTGRGIKPMNVLSRSIFKELFLTFLLGVFALNFLLVTEKMIRLTKRLANVGLSPGDMLSVLVYLQPLFTVLTVPMALFFAILLVYGRMNADNEIVIMRTNGMSFTRIAAPAFVLGIFCLLVSLGASFWVAPAGARKLRQKVADIISVRAGGAIQEGIFNTFFDDIVIFVKKKTDSGVLQGMFMYDSRNRDRPTVVYAREGRVSTEGRRSIVMELKDGHISFVGKESATDLTFTSYKLRVPIQIFEAIRGQTEMTPFGILEAAALLPPKKRTNLMMEFHRRFTFPFLSVVLMVLAPPLSFMAGKTGRFSGLALGFLVIASYNILLLYTEEMVRVGRLSHFAGSWLPAVLFLGVSIYVFMREARR